LVPEIYKMQEYHVPVLFDECLSSLAILPHGVYIDATFGGGGHSRGILSKLGPEGKLIAFDQDADAAKNAEALKTDPRFTFVASNFRHIKKYLRLLGIKQADGVLADLGVSSHQIDEPSRGFSTRFEGPLDMRMNKAQDTTAAHILNTYTEAQLHKLLGIYGEIKNAKTVAANICMARAGQKFESSSQLIDTLRKNAPRGKEFKYYAQVYQALRIEVNQELEALKELLTDTPSILKPQGRLCIISFHSLEDRLVKNYIKTGKFFGDVDKDMFGNELKPLESVSRKPITASETELKLNSRSRSAKLRVAIPSTQ
jgi:16S rRNA (cytosine1402-N4)-methyltransferase